MARQTFLPFCLFRVRLLAKNGSFFGVDLLLKNKKRMKTHLKQSISNENINPYSPARTCIRMSGKLFNTDNMQLKSSCRILLRVVSVVMKEST